MFRRLRRHRRNERVARSLGLMSTGYTEAHACVPPRLIFSYPILDTRAPVGSTFVCECGALWEVVEDFGGLWNEWEEQ